MAVLQGVEVRLAAQQRFVAAVARGLLSWVQAQVLTAAFTRAALASAQRFFAHALALRLCLQHRRAGGPAAVIHQQARQHERKA